MNSRRLPQNRGELLHRQSAGDITSRMTTHSICHRYEAQRGLHREGVFVSAPNAADVTDSGRLQESWHRNPRWRKCHLDSNVGTRRPAPQTSRLRAGWQAVIGTVERTSWCSKRSPTRISGNHSGNWTSGGLRPGTCPSPWGQNRGSGPWAERLPTHGSPSREPRRPSRVLGPRPIWTTGLDPDTLNGCGSFSARQGIEFSERAERRKCPRYATFAGWRRVRPTPEARIGGDSDSRREPPRGAPQEIRRWLQ